MSKYHESPFSKLIMTEVSRNLRNIFFPKIPPILNSNLDFFPVKKSFLQIFQNTANFFHLNFISKKKSKKSENLFSRKKVPATYGVDFFSQKTPDFET